MASLACQSPSLPKAELRAGSLAGPPAHLTGSSERVSGTVEEALAAGPYTYFLLHVGEGDDRWVVVAGREHRGAAHLTADIHARQRAFVSRRLDRTFDELYFGSIPKAPSQAEPQS